MEEGNFTGWLKKEGEAVKAGEPLFTLESEKAQQDVEATDGGVLKLQPDSPNAGDVVKVGQVIGLLLAETESNGGGTARAASRSAASSGATATPDDRLAEREPAARSASSTTTPDGEVAEAGVELTARSAPAISPRARRRAAELGVHIRKLKGSGPAGRITEEDVVKSAASAPNAAPASAMKTSIMRRLIAQRTATGFATIPHFYLRAEVDATALVRLREDLLPEIESATGVRLTLTDFLLRAQAMALRGFPAANCIWMADTLVPLPACDVGLVVGLDEGLMIPVVRSAHEGDLASLAKQRATLVAAAKAGQLTQEQMQGGATSLSNLGNSAVDEFAAVISPGQSSMLAIGRAAPRPFAVAGKLAVRTTLKLCLSVDHRVLDGAPAAEFLGRIVELLEAPDKLL